jgi:hypothetical protein
MMVSTLHCSKRIDDARPGIRPDLSPSPAWCPVMWPREAVGPRHPPSSEARTQARVRARRRPGAARAHASLLLHPRPECETRRRPEPVAISRSLAIFDALPLVNPAALDPCLRRRGARSRRPRYPSPLELWELCEAVLERSSQRAHGRLKISLAYGAH